MKNFREQYVRTIETSTHEYQKVLKQAFEQTKNTPLSIDAVDRDNMEADCISQIEDNPVVRKYTSLTTIELEQLSTNSTERSEYCYYDA